MSNPIFAILQDADGPRTYHMDVPIAPKVVLDWSSYCDDETQVLLLADFCNDGFFQRSDKVNLACIHACHTTTRKRYQKHVYGGLDDVISFIRRTCDVGTASAREMLETLTADDIRSRLIQRGVDDVTIKQELKQWKELNSKR